MNYTQIHYIQIIRFIMYISTFKCQKKSRNFLIMHRIEKRSKQRAKIKNSKKTGQEKHRSKSVSFSHNFTLEAWYHAVLIYGWRLVAPIVFYTLYPIDDMSWIKTNPFSLAKGVSRIFTH